MEGSEKIQTPLLAIGVLFVLTVGVSFIPASWLGVRQQVQTYAPIDLSNLGTSQDSDDDGVVSWREFVSGTLALPSETIDGKDLTVDPKALAVLNDPNNMTSTFSKNLFIASALLKENNITDATSEQETFNQLLAQEAKKIVPSEYAEKDIRVAKTEDAASIKAYGNKLGGLLEDVISKETIVAELTSFMEFLQNADEGRLIPIRNRIGILDGIIDKMLMIEVPPSAVSLHVSGLSSIATFRNTLDNLARAHDDPIRATFSIQTYQKDAVAAARVFFAFKEYFKDKNVVFTSKEAGYVFMSGYTVK